MRMHAQLPAHSDVKQKRRHVLRTKIKQALEAGAICLPTYINWGAGESQGTNEVLLPSQTLLECALLS